MIVQRFLRRSFSTSARMMSEELGGVPGQNLPFNIDNKVTLTMWFILFFGSGLSAPFLILRYNLTKCVPQGWPLDSLDVISGAQLSVMTGQGNRLLATSVRAHNIPGQSLFGRWKMRGTGSMVLGAVFFGSAAWLPVVFLRDKLTGRTEVSDKQHLHGAPPST